MPFLNDAELSTIPKSQAEQIEELQRVLKLGNATLTSPDGLHSIELTDPLYRLLLKIINDIVAGRPVLYTPENQDLTTQQAANVLGMSRQFFVDLLEKGDVPFHRVGNHRRVKLRDVMSYRKQRDQKRHQAINGMAKQSNDDGSYDDF